MIKNFKIGHYTDEKNATGCTVILCPDANTASCFISGSSPGSRELALLSPKRKMQSINALLLTGGSAFGLNATAGVMAFLEEQDIGYETSFAKVPIVPTAVIYDLNIGSAQIRPSAENAMQACREARRENIMQGTIGVGTGATVGKWNGLDSCMKGGLGIAHFEKDGAQITAICVVNAVGDIVDEHGRIIAGAIGSNGEFLAGDDYTSRWKLPKVGMSENTVLCVLLTNIHLTKVQAYNMAKRGQNGLARAIYPANTSFDGDVVFTVSSNEINFDHEYMYEAGAEVVRQAIINSVKNADSISDVPCISKLEQLK
jgi:L-aminopeptidase/D-esterase-like protein